MKLVLIFLLVLDVYAGRSQQSYVIMIQSDNNQPFYARAGQRKMNSSASGHLIIPQLKDSNYVLFIGFPNNSGHEQKFSLKVNGKDQGFQLKHWADSSWVLYNWQTTELRKGELLIDTPAVRKETGQKAMRNGDSFSGLMASVVNDTTGMYASYLSERPARLQKTEILRNVPKTDSAALVTNSAERKQVESKEIKLHADSSGINAKEKTAAIKKPLIKNDSSVAKNKPDSAVVINNKKQLRKPAKGISLKVDSTSMTKNEKRDISPINKTAVSNQDSLNQQKSITGSTTEKPAEVKTSVYEPLHTNPHEKTSGTVGQVITKISEEKYADVWVIEYFIRGRRPGMKNDTVRLMIPVEADSVIATIKPQPVQQVKENRDTLARLPDVTAVAKRQPDTAHKAKEPIVKSITDSSQKSPLYRPIPESKRVIANSDCRNMASEYDVDRLRVKMMAADGIEEMLLAARKLAKGKCFTSKQLKALSEVFPSDEGKYRLFDQFYGYVSDAENFSKLINLLSDPYYVRRFQAMLRN